MSGLDRPRATYQDVLDAPPHVVAELIGGELYLSPRPGLAYAAVVRALASALGAPFARGEGDPRGWIVLLEPELHLGEDVLVPALAGWRAERLQAPPARPGDEPAPDWVCELLAPATEKTGRARKLPLYAAHGVGHAWLVNPAQRFVEVLRRTGEGWLALAAHGDAARVCAEPFAAIELELGLLWADREPAIPSSITSCGSGAAAG
jgi:Uma2 family endonuclease